MTNYDVCLIQGDDFVFTIEVDDTEGNPVDSATISHIYFTCKDLGYQSEFLYDETNQSWSAEILSADSFLFNPIRTTYDITIIYTSNVINTEVYNGSFIVKRKNNTII